MKWWIRLCAVWAMGAAIAAPSGAAADNYPDRPVRIISNSAPGSAPDAVLRIVAERLGQAWGQQIVVMNQPGAGGSLAARAASAAPADGYTLFFAVASAFVTVKGNAPNIPIDVPRDFMPISLIGEQPMFITIAPQTGIKSLPELIEAAKKKPGEITYAVSGRGRQSHLTGELIQRRTGIKLQMVPYSSGGPAQALTDLISGRVHMLIEGGPALIGSIQSGKLTAIAVGSETRLAEFANLPAASETLPGFRSAGWLAMRGAQRHARRHRQKGERRSARDPHQPGGARQARRPRQLCAAAVSAGHDQLHHQGAEHLGARPGGTRQVGQ